MDRHIDQSPVGHPSSDGCGGDKALFVLFGRALVCLVYDGADFGVRWTDELRWFGCTERNFASAGPVFGSWPKTEADRKAGTDADGIARLGQSGVRILEITQVIFPAGGATQCYDEGANNDNYWPLSTSSRVIGPSAHDRWTAHSTRRFRV